MPDAGETACATKPRQTIARLGEAGIQPVKAFSTKLSGLSPSSALQFRVEVTDRCELPCIDCVARRKRLLTRVKIAAAEQVGRGNHCRAHGTVFVSALRPSKFIVQPEIETH